MEGFVKRTKGVIDQEELETLSGDQLYEILEKIEQLDVLVLIENYLRQNPDVLLDLIETSLMCDEGGKVINALREMNLLIWDEDRDFGFHKCGNKPGAMLLLENGADIEEIQDDVTPLVRNLHKTPEVVEVMLDNNASIERAIESWKSLTGEFVLPVNGHNIFLLLKKKGEACTKEVLDLVNAKDGGTGRILDSMAYEEACLLFELMNKLDHECLFNSSDFFTEISPEFDIYLQTTTPCVLMTFGLLKYHDLTVEQRRTFENWMSKREDEPLFKVNQFTLPLLPNKKKREMINFLLCLKRIGFEVRELQFVLLDYIWSPTKLRGMDLSSRKYK